MSEWGDFCPEEVPPPVQPNIKLIKDLLPDLVQDLVHPQPAITLPQWPEVMRVLGGLRPREFTILCAPTGVGKTAFLANLSVQLLRENVKHFAMSVETGELDFLRRVLSILEKKDYNTGDSYTQEDVLKSLGRWCDLLDTDRLALSLYDNRVKSATVCAELEHMAKNGYKVAFIDNLNFLLEVTKSSDQIVEMDRVVHELIVLCKRIDMHVIMVMHPRKTEDGRVVSEFDIKGSSTAVQEAHNVLLLNRPPRKDLENDNAHETDRDLFFAKLRRRGHNVGRTVRFHHIAMQYVEKRPY